MFKKVLAVGFSAVLALSLVACGGSKDNKSKSSKETTTASESEAATVYSVKDEKINKKTIECEKARQGLNNLQLSEKAGLPLGTLQNVLNRRKCLPVTAGKIAKALGVDVTELLED